MPVWSSLVGFKNGLVVLDTDASVPEGAEVTVTLRTMPAAVVEEIAV
jgi:hypothetical protein